MKLFFALVIALAFPATTFAQDVQLVTREVPLRDERSLASPPPSVFHLVGLHWQGPGTVFFRTRSIAGRWSPWRHAQISPLDVPDAGTEEGRSALLWKLGNPYWVGSSNAIQYRLRGRVTRLRAHLIASEARAVPVRRLSVAESPLVIPRAAWRANESIRRGAPAYATSLRFGVVHHTAGTNDYTAAESAAIVRAIQTYHVRGNGWNDIGYNFLVDKYGQVFEGRYGGADRNVVGAHAEGFNTGSVGVALLGSYGSVRPTAKAIDAIASLLAWRLDVAHVDPLSRLTWASGGNARFPTGTPTPLAAVSGHRDTGPSACPGNALYAQLRAIATKAAAIGLPKLYDPVVTGRPGSAVRFTARLSSSLSWIVRVTDGEGNAVASGAGTGQTVDWTWDATSMPAGRYLYAIEAAGARPAKGTIGQTPTTLTLTGAQARPATFTPNGDSRADSTVIGYSLSLPATVTATLRDANALTLATLFSEQKAAGRQSFRFRASGIADGRYTIVLVARGSSSVEIRTEIPIVVDRTLAAFAATPGVYSPNGDRRLDRLTLAFVLAAPAHVRLRIAGGPTVFEGELGPGPHSHTWERPLRDGRHAAVLQATGPFGTRGQTARFLVDTRKPTLRLVNAAARRFWVSEKVTITGSIGGLRVQAVVGPGRFRLAGAVGPIAITAWDAGGNRSALRHR